nr:MAG TPA: hypothetical protein [Caudoviricetes sp.]
MNGLTEQDYAEAFGVELPDKGGAAESETQEPVENGIGDAGEEGTAQEQGTEAQEDGGIAEAGDGEEAVQSAEERSRQAYGRRAREREAERQALTAAAQARVDAVYTDLFAGQTNPYTGQPIRTEADFRAYREARTRQEREEQMLSAGVDPTALRGMVDDAVKPLREEVQRQRLESVNAEARNVTARAQAAIRQGLEAVRVKYDSGIQTLEDIAAMPTGAAFRSYVEKGLSIEDAFYMANREAVDKRRMEAARQAGIKQASGKRHMTPMPGAAGEAPYVATPRQREMYREINPNATDDEINAAYGEFYK